MKKTTIIAIITALFALGCIEMCSAQQKTASGTKSESTGTKSSKVRELNETEFSTLVADYTSQTWSFKGKRPAIVDFSATWCGPCRVLGPTVEEVAEEYADKAIVAKCNVDDCEDISMKYGIRNIPTLVYIKNGEMVDRTVGVVSKQEICARIDKML